jgi:hypothetical protein
MEPYLEEIESHIIRYNLKAKDICGFQISRRGFCGQVNLNTFIDGMQQEGLIIPEYIKRVGKSDFKMYKYNSSGVNIYFKRVCICDDPCSSNSKCVINKNKNTCDNHHVILISLTSSLEIDREFDYIIDMTYKQMIYPHYQDEEKRSEYKSLPDYLFMKLTDYENYKKTEKWVRYINDTCKFIVNFDNEDSIRHKYLKYKTKYLELKKKLNI